jgi:hypothetical protein
VREIKLDSSILVTRAQGMKSLGKYETRPRQENIRVGLNREICCWGGETIIEKNVCA